MVWLLSNVTLKLAASLHKNNVIREIGLQH